MCCISSAWGSLDAVEFLLKHKANVNWSDAKGQTVLMEALHYKQLDCAKRLVCVCFWLYSALK
jgi:ankyrin repeat protein